MKRLCALLLLSVFCPLMFAGDELLQVPVTSNIRKLVPNESANNPTGGTLFPPGGFEVGKEGSIESELLHKYNLAAYVGFAAGVRVFKATYSTVVTVPSAAYRVRETTVGITETSTWNNTPGPAAKIGGLLINVPGGSNPNIAVVSGPLALRMQLAIDTAGPVDFKLVSHQVSTGTAVRMGVQNIRLEAYLKGDASKNDHVDFTDFLILSVNFGMDTSILPTQIERWEHADFDGDGDVDFTDFLQLSANFDERLFD